MFVCFVWVRAKGIQGTTRTCPCFCYKRRQFRREAITTKMVEIEKQFDFGRSSPPFLQEIESHCFGKGSSFLSFSSFFSCREEYIGRLFCTPSTWLGFVRKKNKENIFVWTIAYIRVLIVFTRSPTSSPLLIPQVSSWYPHPWHWWWLYLFIWMLEQLHKGGSLPNKLIQWRRTSRTSSLRFPKSMSFTAFSKSSIQMTR